jgi:hypothetical protein
VVKAKVFSSFSGLKKGTRVSIEYKKDGDKNMAVEIKVAATKKK